MKRKKNEKLKFSFIQLTFWCSWCAFTSFAALFFKSIGLSKPEIGFALSLSTLGGILGQFIWGFLCDKLHTIKKNFMVANLIILASILSFLVIRSTLWVWVMMFVLGFAQIPQPSILDTWILKKLPGKEEEYGHIRLWASLGFAVSALIFGLLIRQFGFTVMFIAASFFISITLLVSFRLEDASEDLRSGKNLKKSFKTLFTNRRYIFFIAVCFIIGLAFRTVHLLLPLILDNVKGTSWDLGLAYFFGVITEIPMFLASKKLSKKYRSNILFLLSVLLFILHFVLLILAKSPFMVITAMFAQGLAFGNYLPAIRLFVNENAPDDLRTSAQTFADAICSSLTGVIGSAAGGIIIERHGVNTVLFIGTGLLSLAFCILLIHFLISRRRSKNQNNRINNDILN
ncbi:MAG TPA: hypothetical protein DD738_06120 [Ruminiclostridium sp.]|nr:hypothetical protein [Ruminiclostridium sp.]